MAGVEGNGTNANRDPPWHSRSIDAKHIAAYRWNQWTEIDLMARFARSLLTETSMSNPPFVALRDKADLLSTLMRMVSDSNTKTVILT